MMIGVQIVTDRECAYCGKFSGARTYCSVACMNKDALNCGNRCAECGQCDVGQTGEHRCPPAIFPDLGTHRRNTHCGESEK